MICSHTNKVQATPKPTSTSISHPISTVDGRLTGPACSLDLPYSSSWRYIKCASTPCDGQTWATDCIWIPINGCRVGKKHQAKDSLKTCTYLPEPLVLGRHAKVGSSHHTFPTKRVDFPDSRPWYPHKRVVKCCTRHLVKHLHSKPIRPGMQQSTCHLCLHPTPHSCYQAHHRRHCSYHDWQMELRGPVDWSSLARLTSGEHQLTSHGHS